MDWTRDLRFVTPLIILISVLSPGVRATMDEYELVTTLMSNYSTDVRPVVNASFPVDVSIGIAFNQLIDLDERNQILTIKVWMRLRWTDETLTWTPSDYDGIKNIRIMANEIWRPDITLYNDVREEFIEVEAIYPADISSDGSVAWNYPAIIKSTCLLDVTYFPWDQQACDLKFGSWTYDGTKIDLFNLSTEGDTSNFIKSGEWDLIGFPNRRNVILYTCCVEPYPDVTFYVIIRRKPLYYLFNLVLPCMFITATTILVFYLPSESGEKVSLGVTVLLALTVFLLLVAETMPPQSQSIPLIGQYFGATIVLLALSTAMTVIVLNVYYRGAFGNEVPMWIRKLVLDWMARVMCLRDRVNDNWTNQLTSKVAPSKDDVLTEQSYQGKQENGGYINNGMVLNSMERDAMDILSVKERASPSRSPTTQSEHLLGQILTVLRGFEEYQSEEKKDDGCKNNWMLVAMVIDRFLLIVFLVLTIVVSCAVLLAHPAYDQSNEFYIQQLYDELDG